MATSVQYGIRHLLVLTLVVAVMMAVLGPMIRAWDTERQMFFAGHAAVTLLLLTGYTCLLCRQRLRVERTAGQIVIRAKASRSLRARVMLAAGIALCVVWMIVQGILWSESLSGNGRHFFFPAISNTWIIVGFLPTLLTRFWWGLSLTSIEVCERGFISGAVGFLPYSRLKHYRWARHSANTLVVASQFMTRNIAVPPEFRAEVEKMLESHGVPGSGESPVD